MYRILKNIAIGSLACSLPATASITVLSDTLRSFDVVTLENYNLNNETEGTAYAGGDLNLLSGNGRFGFNSGTASNDSEVNLVLNNDITGNGSVTLLSGSLVTRLDNPNTSGVSLNGNAPGAPSIQTGEAAFAAELNALGVATSAEFHNSLRESSIQLANLASNSTVTATPNGAFTFDASDAVSSVAVFDTTADFLSNRIAGDRLEVINFSSDTSIIINVSGTTVPITDNLTSGFNNNESNILFNFYEATEITLSSNFRGNILAPLATVIQNANIDGGIIANNFTQNAEVHTLGFSGDIPAVPEPSSVMLLATASCFIFKRKRVTSK